jgi:hypothetical protein
MDDQKLWNLLGRKPRPSAPPFFAGKVMRQIEVADERSSWLAPVVRWLAPASVATLLVLAILPRSDSTPAAMASPSDLTTLDLVEMLSPEDYTTLTAAGWPYNNGFLSAGL